MLKIKNYRDVEIGDSAFYISGPVEFAGKVLAKGSWLELYCSYRSTISYRELREESELEPDELLECLAISQNPAETLEGFENLIFLYNYDPSSVIVKK